MGNPDYPNMGQTRIFVQEDGLTPAAPYHYHGGLTLGGLNEDLGDLTPIYLPSRDVPDSWDIVDEAEGNQSLPTSDFTAHMRKFLTDVWFKLKRTKCRVNIQIKIDSCGKPDDFNQWESKFLFTRAKLINLATTGLSPLTGDENAIIDLTGSLTGREWIPIKRIRFEEEADATILAEVVDGIYNDQISCGDCGVESEGCSKRYWLTRANAGSPGLSGQVAYTTDDGSTWATIDIPTLGGLSADAIAAVGNRAVVVSEATGSHHHIRFSQLDAGNAASWSEVTGGYEAGGSPRWIYSKSSGETFIAGAGGYIYKMTDPTSAVSVLTDGSVTTQDLNKIDGDGDTVVAIGANNAVLVSSNSGATFAAVTGPQVGANLTALAVLSPRLWWIGTGDGNLYYTVDGGDNWVDAGVDSVISVINDIKFYNESIGYFAAQVGGGSRVYRTDTMGNTWFYESPHISDLPTAERYNALAVCGPNEVSAGGRVSAGGDGILAIAR